MASGIYRITCTVNDRCYIGSSGNIARRWKRHRDDLRAGTHHSITLQRAWAKHGADTFTWEVLESVTGRAALIERERFYLHRDQPFYNNLVVAETTAGMKHSDDVRARMTAAQLARFERLREAGPIRHSAEHRAAISAARKGYKPTEEARQHMSDAAKARGMAQLHNPTAVAKRGAALRGKPLSNAHKQALHEGQQRALARGTHRWSKQRNGDVS